MSKQERKEKDRRSHYEIGRKWAEAYLKRCGAVHVDFPNFNFAKGDNGHGIHLYTRLHDNPNKEYEDAQDRSMDVNYDKAKYNCNLVEVILIRTYEKDGDYQKGYCYLVRVPQFVLEKEKVNIRFTDDAIRQSECEYIPLDPVQFSKHVKKATLTPEEESFIEDVEQSVKVLSNTERDQVIRARVGQSLFKDKLLKRSQKCEYCGLPNVKLLTASHIKDWSQCETNIERLDANNGLLLCPNHDKAFDLKMLSFDESGYPLISKSLSTDDCMLLNIDPKRKITLKREQQGYMAWHQKASGFTKSQGEG